MPWQKVGHVWEGWQVGSRVEEVEETGGSLVLDACGFDIHQSTGHKDIHSAIQIVMLCGEEKICVGGMKRVSLWPLLASLDRNHAKQQVLNG